MKEKLTLAKHCKYYKGEEYNPDPMNKIWDYERFWVEEHCQEEPKFSFVLDGYIDAGLRSFNLYDDTPMTLKAILYNRFMQQAEGMAKPEDFKHWYDTFYRPKVCK